MFLKDELGNKNMVKFKIKTSVDGMEKIKKSELEYFLKYLRPT